MKNDATATAEPRRGLGGVAGTAMLLAATLGLTGCDDLLQVTLPGEIETEQLDNPESVGLLVSSAQAAFECAFTNYTLLAGNVTDELLNTGSFESFLHYDQRTIDADHGAYSTGSCASDGGLYTPLSQARFLADDAIERLEGYSDAEVPDRTAHLARASLYAGYSYIVFGEGFCEAAFDEGPALSPEEIFALAEDRLSDAIEHAGASGEDEILNAAYVGRARARLNLGEADAAAADARNVPEGFVALAGRSEVEELRENKIFLLNHLERRTVVGPPYWDLEWEGVADPRVDVDDTGRLASDGLTPLMLQTKYTSRSSPLPFATEEEALLIVAEAEGGETAVELINELHARAGLPRFDSTDPDEIMDHVLQERKRELFLESHRMGDLRRYDLSFPTGRHEWNDRPYGDLTCFPIPNVERHNNPNLG